MRIRIKIEVECPGCLDLTPAEQGSCSDCNGTGYQEDYVGIEELKSLLDEVPDEKTGG